MRFTSMAEQTCWTGSGSDFLKHPHPGLDPSKYFVDLNKYSPNLITFLYVKGTKTIWSVKSVSAGLDPDHVLSSESTIFSGPNTSPAFH